MQTSVSAADLESAPPESTSSSSADEADVDWTFAKREAAFAKLGLDPTLDNLPDEDLNKLFDKISKVKTLRGHGGPKSRPESSLSHVDDIWSESGRPFSSDALTDDSSWDQLQSRGSPQIDDSLKDVQNQLEFRLHAITESSTEAEDLKVEKDHMQHQLQMIQNQMRRIIDARSRGEIDPDLVPFEPVIYTARQLRLIRKVLDKWRAHRAFSMAEIVLSNAVVIKEANVIRFVLSRVHISDSDCHHSKELGKDVSYNFTIAAGGSLAAPSSAVDTIAGLDEFGDVADPVLASATQPSVAVKVLDKRHNAVYSWSFDRLQQQLQRMRNLTTYIDRPSYTQHFSSDEPFYDIPPPEYSFIGNALLCLAPLSRRLSSTSAVPIFCRYTAEAIGSCRIDVKIVNVTISSKHGSTSSTRASSPSRPPGTISSGSKVCFFLTIDSVKGLSSHEFSAVHLQVRLSSFVGSGVGSEEVFPSSAVDIEALSLSDLKFRRSFTVAATSKTLAHLKQGYAPIEFFAAVKPTYLERLEHWDELRDQTLPPPSGPSTPPSESVPVTLPPMRRSETDFVVQQVHDVVAWLQICELGPDGQYEPVPVVSQGALDPGSFSLHQGLQRRIVLMLSSNSGQQLPWIDFTKIRIGNVRLLDPKGRIHESTAKTVVALPLQKEQSLEFRPDGTSALRAEALWDSSVHDSVLLNRVTATNQRILLQISWFVAVEICSDPVQFSMDMAITIQSRDARPPSRFLSFLGSNKILSKTSTVFNVRLCPPLTRSPKDLWRLDTAEKYVRGEESLGVWKPRGLSVVEDYSRLIYTERRAADVQAIRIILTNTPPRPSHAEAMLWGSEALLQKSLELWQKQFGHRGKVCIVLRVGVHH